MLLRRVLRRCVVVACKGKKGSQNENGFLEGGLRGEFPEGA